MIENLVYGVIGSLIGSLATYVIARKLLSFDRMMDFFDEATHELTTDVEMQKKLYLVGGILGQGIKSGIGMGTKRGKFKIEDIIAEGAGMFLSQILQKNMPQQLNTSNPSTGSLNEPFK